MVTARKARDLADSNVVYVLLAIENSTCVLSPTVVCVEAGHNIELLS